MATDNNIVRSTENRKRKETERSDMFDLSEDDNVHSAINQNTLIKSFELKTNETRDDPDGFCIFRTGEILGQKYKVLEYKGKGVFSSVFLAHDVRDETQKRCIKIIRRNEVMRRAGQKEIQILKRLFEKEHRGRPYCVKFFESFNHQDHLCLVFETLSLNLRQLIQKGGSVGVGLKTIRLYAAQLLKALSFLKDCDLIHADVKPDNILVNSRRNIVKICDFGSAFDSKRCSVTPYLCSRYYRPPEIVLGCEYDSSVDMWSFGCVLFELYTGRILFNGENNNAMVKLFMELLGPIPNKILKRAAFVSDHFDPKGVFLCRKIDSLTGAVYMKPMAISKSKKDLLKKMHSASLLFNELDSDDKTKVRNLKNLIEKCLKLDPFRRITPNEALLHPFITESQ